MIPIDGLGHECTEDFSKSLLRTVLPGHFCKAIVKSWVWLIEDEADYNVTKI